ncbi:MAG: CvpA family protein [Ruminococcus sp.]|nr:CvpA family protein [Ruminococcus sp.]
MIYDIIVILIILISVVVGYKVGAAKTLLSLIGSIATFMLAVFLGDYLSNLIYDNFISQSIISSVTESLSVNGSTISANTLPLFVRFAFGLTNTDLESLLSNAVNAFPETVATSVESALKPVVISVLSFLFTSILFIVVYFLFRVLLLKVLLRIFKLPIIKGLNSILGVLCALINSVLLISFLAFLLKLIMPYLNNVPYIFSESIIYNSYIFYHFYSGNIFSTILSVF